MSTVQEFAGKSRFHCEYFTRYIQDSQVGLQQNGGSEDALFMGDFSHIFGQSQEENGQVKGKVYSGNTKGKTWTGKVCYNGQERARWRNVGKRRSPSGTVPENRSGVKTEKSFLGCEEPRKLFSQVGPAGQVLTPLRISGTEQPSKARQRALLTPILQDGGTGVC